MGADESPAETPSQVSPTSGAPTWPTRRGRARSRLRFMLVAGAIVTPLCVAVVLSTDLAIGGEEQWPMTAVIVITLSGLWSGREVPRTAAFWSTAAVLTLLSLLAAILVGYPPLSAAWLVVANLVVALLCLRLYRSGLEHTTWEPRTPAALVTILLACLASALVAGALGAYPGLDLSAADTTPVAALWWSVRGLVSLWVGCACFLVFWYWREPPVLGVRHPLLPVAIFAAGIGAMWIPFAFPDLPLLWLGLVPALWAGMSLTPLSGALYVLCANTAAGFASSASVRSDRLDGDLVSAIIIDLLIVFSTFVTMLLVLFRDQRGRLLSELREQREAARSQAELLEAVFESISDGMILADPRTGSITMHNRSARTLLGRQVPARAPTSWTDYFAVRAADGSRRVVDSELTFLSRLEQGPGSEHDYGITGQDGLQRIVAATSQRVPTAEGTRLLLLFHDVTAEHARVRELRGFAGTVAHDLRGPLTSLSGWMEAADDELAEDDPVAGRMALYKARQASLRMRHLIDEYLAFTVTREGLLRLGEVPLAELVDEVTDLYVSDDPRLDPRFEIDVTHVSRVDRALTRQLLANLVGNAVKYSRPGVPAHVTVRSRTDAEPGWVQVAVVDRGVGLQPGDEERIFAVFERSDKDADAYQGTGLGLALCHSIVARHGGHISASSNEFGGATFCFTLPAA